MSPDYVSILVQIPLVAALIYLVLKLEDKRQESAKIREEANRRTVEALLGVIDELSARNAPDRINSRQLNLIQDYLREEQRRKPDEP